MANTHGPLAKFQGRVIAWREKNGYDDSDFQAFVEHTPGDFGWVTYASTAYGCDWPLVATIDATSDVLTRYEAAYSKHVDQTADLIAKSEMRTRPANGTVLRVTKGRKHAGKVGVVTWSGEDQFKSNRHSTVYRVRIETTDGEQFYTQASQTEALFKGQWIEVFGRTTVNTGLIGMATYWPPVPALVA